MKFCTSCGKEKVDNSPFCTHCGKKFEEELPVQNRTTTNTLPTWKKLSLKMKILIGTLVFVVIASFGLYKWGESVTDQKSVLAAFTEHVEKGEANKLLSMIDTSDPTLPITEERIQQLLAYLEEYPSVKEDVFAQLQLETATNAGSLKATTSYDEFDALPLIRLEKKGKHFLLFDRYRFVLQSFPLYVSTNDTDDLQLFIDGEKVTQAPLDSGTFELGNQLPGVYKLKAVLQSNLVKIEKEIEVSHFFDTYVDLYLDIDSIELGANVEGATVLVDGKDSTLKTMAQSYIDVGPVLMDGSMNIQVVKETPFGEVQSPAIPIEQYMIEANVQLNDEQKMAIQEQLKSFLLNYSKALMNRDISILHEHSDVVSDYTKADFNHLVNSQFMYAGYLKEAAIDGDSYYIEQNDGEWLVFVHVSEIWNEDFVYSGDPISLSEETYASRYLLVFNEEENNWVVRDWESTYDFDMSQGISLTIDEQAQKTQFEESAVFQSYQLEEATSSISPFVESYLQSGVDALNERDFSLVSDYLIPSSTYAKEVADYIKYIESKGITEDLVRADIVNIEQKDEETFIVSTFEEYYIYYSDGSSAFKSFDSKYEVKTTADGMKMNKAIEIKERGK